MEFLPYTIAKFRQIFPGIHFNVHVFPPKEVSSAAINGDADIGLTFSLKPTPDIRVVHLQKKPILAVLPIDHPLAFPYPDTTVRQLFDICASQQQLQYEPALVSNYMAALNQFTMNHCGISFCGEISVRRLIQNGMVKGIPISDKGMSIRNIEVQVLTGRTLPKAVQSFLDFVIEEIKNSEE